MSHLLWLWTFLFLLLLQLYKMGGVRVFVLELENVLRFSFFHQGFQSSMFFKMAVFLLSLFWSGGMFFPLYCPWASVCFLVFLTTFSWFGVRLFTLLYENFLILFESEHSWNWGVSLVMFFAHLLSYLMSGVALALRISIIFLIGHFLMFIILGSYGVVFSYIFLFFVLPVEFFFAFLQSYIFLTLVCMFLLNMI
uniref:ATP synthase F0 subunit 6 n=1 Tax=Physaloptera rara TaxID=2358290 RepID=A0A4Y6I5U3_9BILA|nr:ATP synthase F0 subunit 6 [Physaloptera rara]